MKREKERDFFSQSAYESHCNRWKQKSLLDSAKKTFVCVIVWFCKLDGILPHISDLFIFISFRLCLLHIFVCTVISKHYTVGVFFNISFVSLNLFWFRWFRFRFSACSIEQSWLLWKTERKNHQRFWHLIRLFFPMKPKANEKMGKRWIIVIALRQQLCVLLQIQNVFEGNINESDVQRERERERKRHNKRNQTQSKW